MKDIRAAIENEATALPDSVREVARLYVEQIDTLSEKIDALTFKLREIMQVSTEMRRLCTVPGVGPVTADAIMACQSASNRDPLSARKRDPLCAARVG